MVKCLEYGSYLTELEEVKTGDESVRSTKNDKSDGELSEIDNVNCGKDVKEEGKQKKNLDLKMLTRSVHSRLSGPKTQPCTPLGSKKIPDQNVENGCSFSSSKFAFCLHIC
jgi:hypothetical protein